MSRINIPSVGRLVTNTEWINYRFLPTFFAFLNEPGNRGIRANVRGLGQTGIRLFNGLNTPAEIEVTSEQLLKGIVAGSHIVKTRMGHIHERKRGLDLLLMLEFNPALRREFATVRRNFAQTTGQPYYRETPAVAYGIPLARLAPETVEPQHRQPLLTLVETIRPANVILGKAQPLA